MRRLPGQAGRGLTTLLHRLAAVVLAVVVLLSVAVAAAAWRLSQGPVELDWLSRRIENAVNAEEGKWRLSIGGTALAWEGFRLGVDRPLDLRLTDIALTDTSGHVVLALPHGAVSLSLRQLLVGRIVPRSVELDDARLIVLREKDGSITLGGEQPQQPASPDAGNGPSMRGIVSVPTLLRELARPAIDDQSRRRGRFSQMHRLRVRNAAVTIIDRQLGTTWRAPDAQVDLVRRPSGGVAVNASLALALGTQRADLAIAGILLGDGGRSHLSARMSPIAPAALADAAAMLKPLSVLNAPISEEAEFDLDQTLHLVHGRVAAQIGAGALNTGSATVPVRRGGLVISGSPDRAEMETAFLEFAGRDDGPASRLTATGDVQRATGRIDAQFAVDVDQVSFADLSRLWPPDVGRGAREWVTTNITSGMARSGHVQLALSGTDDLSDIALTQASGQIDGQDLNVVWLRPVPPIVQGRAQLRVVDPDTIDIVVSAGEQRVAGGGNLTVRSGDVRISGLSGHDQVATITADIAGPVAGVIALLREPRLQLLDRHPIELKDPAGEAAINLSVRLPLQSDMTMDDVSLRAQAHLTQVHLSGIVAGRDLDQGVLDLDADTNGLTLKGEAVLAGIAARLDATMDFRPGPSRQVMQRIIVSGRAGAGQLAAAGLDAGDFLRGSALLNATLSEYRNGEGDIAIQADLADAVLAVPQTGWSKPAGVPAKATAQIALFKDRLRGASRFQIDGNGLALRGYADGAGDRFAAVHLDRALFGRTEGRGTIKLPAGGPIAVTMEGTTVDLAARLAQKRPAQEKPDREPPPESAWTLSARFDRAYLAHDQIATGVRAEADYDGRIFRSLSVNGTLAPRAPFSLTIDGRGSQRSLTANAADGGALLRGLDIVTSMQGGQLSVHGTYDDAVKGHPLIATADINAFRIQGAPGLGKLLQAMTLYGLVDVLRGPGIGFSHLIAPVQLQEGELILNDARAFSSSLGLTAKGRVDLRAQRLDIQGTIVPAYFFNSLLGNIPLVGKLFSPERGGGVFAARYALHGDLNDPSVSVNPLSALTPGFLREIFGLF